MFVMQLSNTENSVGAGCPCKVCVISRLRRVAAFIATNWLSCSSTSASMCGGSWFCVVFK